jgi:hypothetical protein
MSLSSTTEAILCPTPRLKSRLKDIETALCNVIVLVPEDIKPAVTEAARCHRQAARDRRGQRVPGAEGSMTAHSSPLAGFGCLLAIRGPAQVYGPVRAALTRVRLRSQ